MYLSAASQGCAAAGPEAGEPAGAGSTKEDEVIDTEYVDADNK